MTDIIKNKLNKKTSTLLFKHIKDKGLDIPLKFLTNKGNKIKNRGRPEFINVFFEDLKDLIPLNRKNNETVGLTAEYVFGKLYKLDMSNILHRNNKNIENELRPVIEKIKLNELSNFPLVIYTGATNNSVDFKLISDTGEVKTLSLKTSMSSNSSKVAPQNIGQPTRRTFDNYFMNNSNNSDEDRKLYILNNPKIMINKYIDNLFCCDYCLYLYKKNDKWVYNLIDSDIKYKIKINFENSDNSDYSFTRTLEIPNLWTESTTIKYNSLSIGEFQFHSNRDNIKFRFNLLKLLKII